MPGKVHHAIAAALLLFMLVMAGGSALHESAAVDEVAHVGAGLSYLQRLDMRFNPEHPPLAKVLAALPLAITGTRADYSSPAWTISTSLFVAYGCQWLFGDAVLGRWNAWRATLMWARAPMLILTLLLGWCVYIYAARIGGLWGGLLCLALYVTTPAFLAFGPLVLTDLPVTLFTLISLWQLGEIWAEPSSKNTLFFALALAAALLSKFTGLLIFLVMLVLFAQTKFWPTANEPVDKQQRRLWRRARWRAILRSVAYALVLVYAVYFVLSWNEPSDALSRIGIGPLALLVRRLLMPLLVYISGLFLMLMMGSRSSYLFGHVLPHGVPYYFPVVFLFKSTLGFLLLLLLAAATAIFCRKRRISVIPQAVGPHWRALSIGFFVFLAVCLASQLDISIRHFMVPIVLLIVMLAPLPRMMAALPRARVWQTAAGVLVASCFISILVAYPYFMPFVSSLAFGRPVYYLLNDSNVSWNEGLPAVENFVQEQQLHEIELDWAGLSDPAAVVPQARAWDCQAPTDSDAGRWVAVAAVSILENHTCGYLQQYPQRKLAGGGFYVFKMPVPIPPAGAPGGPPALAQRKIMWGMQMDLRAWVLNLERHPEQLPAAIAAQMEQYRQMQQQKAAQASKKAPS
jgi:hypothetical protein